MTTQKEKKLLMDQTMVREAMEAFGLQCSTSLKMRTWKLSQPVQFS
jgi:hypothetical protein